MAPRWQPDAPTDASERSNASSDVFIFPDVDRSIRSSSTASGRGVEHELQASRVLGGPHRRTLYSDRQLRDMAATARADIDWDALEQELMYSDSSVWKPQRRRTTGGDGNATVSTLQTDGAFAVAAVSTIPCSVAELRLVFRSRSREQLESVMGCVYSDAFLSGDLVHIVPSATRSASSTSVGSAGSTATMASNQQRPSTPDEELSIKTMRFDKASFLATREDWCFLESVYSLDAGPISASNSNSSGKAPPPTLGRTLISLPVSSCRLATNTDKKKKGLRKAKAGERVAIHFCFREDASGRSTRVLFHGEFLPAAGRSRDNAWRFVRSRLISMAEQSSRFMLVVRRRRLGMQVLVDPSRIATSNANCVCCSRSFRLAKKRLCFLCGYLACDRCSRMQQREFFARGQPHTHTHIEDVRLCVRCIMRVDHCKFSNVTEDDMYPAAVVPDASPEERGGRQRVQSDQQLTDLLEQSLVDATTTRKVGVKSVMRYLVEIERDSSKVTGSSFVSAVLSSPPNKVNLSRSTSTGRGDSSADRSQREQLEKMDFRGPLDTGTPLDECKVANADVRSYAIQIPDDVSQAVAAPRGPSEQKRVETIKRDKLDDLGDVPELDIICSIASKELQCAVSMVTLVESEQLRVLASTSDAFSRKAFPREEGFCSHTVLSHSPLLVPNAQADVRFSAMRVVQHMGASFYCGFPLVAADDTVIGSVCCVDMKPRQLTRAQYASMKSLAVTASKVVQRAAMKRKLSEPAGM